MRHFDDVICETVDQDGNLYSVSKFGDCSIMASDGSVVREDGCSSREVINHAVVTHGTFPREPPTRSPMRASLTTGNMPRGCLLYKKTEVDTNCCDTETFVAF